MDYNWIEERLDMYCVNADWFVIFLQAAVINIDEKFLIICLFNSELMLFLFGEDEGRRILSLRICGCLRMVAGMLWKQSVILIFTRMSGKN